MTRVFRIFAFGAAVTACQGREPTSPGSPAAAPPVIPTEPNPPLITASIVTDGVYRLIAPITQFDPVWGDLSGSQYVATFVIKHHPTFLATLVGTFSGFAHVDADGQQSESSAGTVYGFVDQQGMATFELSNSKGSVIWRGRGKVAPGRVDGSWASGGHFSGLFSAELVK